MSFSEKLMLAILKTYLQFVSPDCLFSAPLPTFLPRFNDTLVYLFRHILLSIRYQGAISLFSLYVLCGTRESHCRGVTLCIGKAVQSAPSTSPCERKLTDDKRNFETNMVQILPVLSRNFIWLQSLRTTHTDWMRCTYSDSSYSWQF